MTFQEKFVAVVLSQGKILRENRKNGFDEISIPFGSDYSLRFKNLNSERVLISVSIDGTDVLSGSKIVVNPNESMDLQGFLENDVVKNKFRFIEKTENVKNHRGDKIDDGIIRIEYQFEKKPVIKHIVKEYIDYVPVKRYLYPSPYDYPWYPSHPWDRYGTWCSTDFGCSSDNIGSSDQSSVLRSGNFSKSESLTNDDANNEGITVKGEETSQKFSNTYVNDLEETKNVILFKLVGTKNNEKIVKPITTKEKITCSSCGKRNKSNFQFCNNCGTFLK